MTTVFPFQPSSAGPFTFQPVLDGQTYTARVSWNIYRHGWYVDLFTLQGDRVFTLPLAGSSAGLTLETLQRDQVSGVVTATATVPHGYAPGQLVRLTVSNAAPDGYNGRFECRILGPDSFAYTLPDDPGAAMAQNTGAASYDISLTDNYFESTLVYREPSRQFEVSP